MEELGNIAVFLAGWNSEYQTRLINGIIRKAKEANYAISIFTCQAGSEISDKHVLGENKIYSLANLSRFDGIIFATNTIWEKPTKEEIIRRIHHAGIPAVSFEEKVEGLSLIGIDNYKAMREMIEHVDSHGYHPIHFVAANATNEESNIRQKAFEDFVKEKNYSAEDYTVWHGDFSFDSGVQVVDAMEEAGRMPRALCCANDEMALGACNRLKQLGYQVPQDIAVTGFDGSYDTRRYIPGITTVDRPKETLGYTAMQLLLQEIETGKKQELILTSRVAVHESCGCVLEDKKRVASAIETLYLEKKENEKYTYQIHNMEDEMMECESLEELIFCIRQNIGKFTTEDVYLCLNKSIYYEMTGRGNSILRNRTITRDYENTIYITKLNNEDGMPEFYSFTSEQMFPAMWNGRGSGEYLYMPVHFRDNCLGYMILTGTLDTKHIPNYYVWIRNISNALEKLKNVSELRNAARNIDNMAVRDSLTGVYNRMGINRFVVDMVKQANTSRRRLLFVFADMDGLKKINDEFGHEAGDQAICLAAEALQEAFCEKELIIRYGGDEFLVVSDALSWEQAEEKKAQITALLKQWQRDEKLPYRLSMSIGYYQKEPDTEASMEQYINWADERMYEMKCKNREQRK